GRGSAALDHGVGIDAGQGRAGQGFGLAPDGAEEWSFGIVGDPGGVDIGFEIRLKIMMTGHFVTLAAFFAEADPEAAALAVDVLDLHAERGADAREAIYHQTDQ